MKSKGLRVLAGILGIFLIISTVSVASSSLPKEFCDRSTYRGGVLLGSIFLVYAIKGKSLVNK